MKQCLAFFLIPVCILMAEGLSASLSPVFWPGIVRESLLQIKNEEPFLPSGQVLTVLWRGEQALPRMALTFDDGPSPDHTPHILDILRDHHVLATFFVVGKYVEKNPELARRIVQEGHEIGNHTFNHTGLHQTGPLNATEDIIKAQETIQRVLGVEPIFYRPPYGAGNLYSLQNVARTDIQYTVMWDIDPKDWEAESSEEIVSVLKGRVRNGSIVLLHDNTPHTVEALPQILEDIRGKGIQPGRVSDLFRPVKTGSSGSLLKAQRGAKP